MGSGCNPYNKRNFQPTIPSDGISWQGDTDVSLNICVDDSLTEVGNVILEKIKDLLQGRGIFLPDLTLSDCEYLEDILDNDEKNLINILKTYKEAICQLQENLENSATGITNFSTVAGYTLGCLEPLSDPCDGPTTFKTLVQAIITKVCQLNANYGSIASSMASVVQTVMGDALVAGFVKSAGNNGLITTGSGATGRVVITGLVPPFAPIPYIGTNTYFDGNGVGLANTPMQGWYLCNGLNGTPAQSALPQNGSNTIKYIMRLT